jgi:hypothetical protein
MERSALRKFFELPSADRALLMQSVMLIGMARVALWILPFNVARRLLTPGARNRAATTTTEKIGWAISVGKGFVPKANCLPQALAAESLLLQAGHPVEFRIGVAKTPDGQIEAHAWVESSGRLVVGDLTQGLSTYTPLPPVPAVRF